ncbi:multiple epidermal growth factor-like domains protein 11 [Mya arenaria]|uniref:multiple epidermal growth factor-like domains protein 11 n=1 Tax=Mya arenaria TaxID=6604 RepID=UPI0022DEE92C|nr:multiple epidermal growth factor-like domains protein 11 [Mya arenaria]
MNATLKTSFLVAVLVIVAKVQLTIAVALDATCSLDCDCTVANSKCSTTCVCADGFTKESTVCKANYGTACTVDGDCITGGKCDLFSDPKVCAIKEGDTCNGGGTDNSAYCVSNAACTGTSNTVCACSSGYTADGTTNLCVADLDTTCVSSSHCSAGICDTKMSPAKCKIEEAATCNDGTTDNSAYCVSNAACTASTNSECACSSGYTVNTVNSEKLCQADYDTVCAADTDCIADHVCDTSLTSPVCKKDLGQTCTSGQCVSPATCDTTCKSGLGGACSADVHCSAGFCDTSVTPNKCSIKAAGTGCTTDDHCVANAQCTSGSCACSSGYTNDHATPASAKYCKGSAGTTCVTLADCDQLTNLICDTALATPVCRKKLADCFADQTNCVTNSECGASACACMTGYSQDATSFVCEGAIDKSCANHGGCDADSDLVCDIGGTSTCKKGATTACTSGQCITNAACECSVCACSSSATLSTSGLCEVQNGATMGAYISAFLLVVCLLVTML